MKEIVIEAREKGPGPGRYALPSTCGFIKHDPSRRTFPAYSFGSRLKQGSTLRPDCSPGPVYFINPCITRYGRDGTPQYSCLGRQKDPKMFKTPSPGAYSPEKCHPPGEKHQPNYSVSARTRLRRRDNNPAPSRYSLPTLLGPAQPDKLSYPSYSMAGRNNIGSYSEDLSSTPGPGRYHAIEPNVIRIKKPQYSLQGRSHMPGDTTKKPGPGAHGPEQVTINKSSPPSHSLGIRHTEYITPLLDDFE